MTVLPSGISHKFNSICSFTVTLKNPEMKVAKFANSINTDEVAHHVLRLCSLMLVATEKLT